MELQEIVEELKSENTVNKQQLSSTYRKFNSIHDKRKSAQNIGFVGVVFLGTVSCLIVIPDIINFFSVFKTLEPSI